MRALLLGWFVLTFAGVAAAQDSDLPPDCRIMPNVQTDWNACLAVAPAGSSARTLALINLGTQALMERRWSDAARYYDDARPPGGQRLYSDAQFHANRAATYEHVGRLQEALVDADIAADMLSNAPTIPAAARQLNAQVVVYPDAVYPLIIPILKRAGDARYEAALSTYRALPADNWGVLANRATLLDEIGESDAALADSTRALAMQPNHPGLLNNHCYILARANRAPEALTYCEQALALLPNDAAVHDSYATALAGAGRCEQAERERAEARRLDPSDVSYKQPLRCVAR